MTVRVRFAPSPTGPLHLGNVRTAVINWLFSLKMGGSFILRIEDTDPERSDPAFEELIIKELSWLGIVPDEGPVQGGDFGPYRQSERGEIYRRVAGGFLEEGRAYRCFCSDDELKEEKGRAISEGRPPRYSGRCRNLDSNELTARRGEPYTLRFKVNGGEIAVKDLIHGDVTFPEGAFGDFVILRGDGSPVYNFSSTVDDHLMGITHIIRGEDHLPNTPRQILLHQALGGEPPIFVHHPLLMTGEGEKIKKRMGVEGGLNLEVIKDEGYTPEAVFNYLATIGNPVYRGKGIMTPDEFAETFDIERLGRGAVRVEMDKLKRMNHHFIRGLDEDGLKERIIPFLKSEGIDVDRYDGGYIAGFVNTIGDNIDLLTDALDYAPIFFSDIPPINSEADGVLKREDTKAVLGALLRRFDALEVLDREGYKSVVNETMEETGVRGKSLYLPLRAAITGMLTGPELDKIVVTLGIGRVRERIILAKGESS